MNFPLKKVHNITRPGQEPKAGDTIEIETSSGHLMEIDPKTKQPTKTRKQFKVELW
jgi:hypothetical protein